MIEKITAITICDDGGSMLSDYATVIEIADEGAGEFVQISQPFSEGSDKKIGITKDEWPLIKRAVEKMLKSCKG